MDSIQLEIKKIGEEKNYEKIRELQTKYKELKSISMVINKQMTRVITH